MHLTIDIPAGLLVLLAAVLVLWIVVRKRRSYQEDKEEAETKEKIERLEAEVAHSKYIL